MTPHARIPSSSAVNARGLLGSTAPLDLVDTAPLRSAHDEIGFELGWDYAHHGVTPPAPYADEPSPLCDGLRAGAACFGARALVPTRPVQKWLQLRLHAWLRGRSVELVQVTPNYLKQLDVAHCPITRNVLSAGTPGSSDASIDRVRNDAGYAAGNLAVISTRANLAKGALGFREVGERRAQLEADGLTELDGLSADAWARLATLCSFVEPLGHAEACAVPMRVLPPNRLRLFNPVQALQAFISQQLLTPGWSGRIARFEELLPNKDVRRDFKRFFMTLLPRVLEGGRLYAQPEGRWAVEDAWGSPQVQQRWTGFASQLTPAQCEALLQKAAARRLTTRSVVATSDATAIDGWNIGTRGYVPHRSATRAAAREMRQARLC